MTSITRPKNMIVKLCRKSGFEPKMLTNPNNFPKLNSTAIYRAHLAVKGRKRR